MVICLQCCHDIILHQPALGQWHNVIFYILPQLNIVYLFPLEIYANNWHSECIAISQWTVTIHCNWPRFNWVKEGNKEVTLPWPSKQVTPSPWKDNGSTSPEGWNTLPLPQKDQKKDQSRKMTLEGQGKKDQ